MSNEKLEMIDDVGFTVTFMWLIPLFLHFGVDFSLFLFPLVSVGCNLE